MKYYVFAGKKDGLCREIFKDFEKNPDVVFIDKVLPFSEYINLLIGDAATRWIKSPILEWVLYFLAKMYNPFKNIDNEQCCLIISNGSIRGLSPKYIDDFLKKHDKCFPIMLFLDPADAYFGRYAKMLVDKIEKFRCVTYSQEDAGRLKYHYTMSYYSMQDIDNTDKKYDIYFSFSGTSRLKLVQSIAERLKDNNVTFNFWIADMEKNRKYVHEYGKDIEFVAKRKKYQQVIEDTAESNCILEIIKEEVCGATLRYYEAVCYNKKLLTNNKNIVNLPFYNSKYMKIFNAVEDIDCEWIKSKDKVDYGYDGRFSPEHLLEEIDILTAVQ